MLPSWFVRKPVRIGADIEVVLVPRATGGSVANVVGFCHKNAIAESSGCEGQRDSGGFRRVISHFRGQRFIECSLLLFLELPEENDGGLVLCPGLAEGVIRQRKNGNYSPGLFARNLRRFGQLEFSPWLFEESIGDDEAKPSVSLKEVDGAFQDNLLGVNPPSPGGNREILQRVGTQLILVAFFDVGSKRRIPDSRVNFSLGGFSRGLLKVVSRQERFASMFVCPSWWSKRLILQIRATMSCNSIP